MSYCAARPSHRQVSPKPVKHNDMRVTHRVVLGLLFHESEVPIDLSWWKPRRTVHRFSLWCNRRESAQTLFDISELHMPTSLISFPSRVGFVTAVAAGCLFSSYRTLEAQNAAPTSMTLGGAARMAAERSASTAAARERSSQADARVSQSRAALLPNLSTSAQYGTRSYNTASLGLDIPAGSPIPINPDGEVQGPVRSIDVLL